VRLEDATALVTGASSGIGAATAAALAERGVTVGLVARRRDRLDQVLETCRAHAPASRVWVVDLSDVDAAEKTVAEAVAAFGRLDVLVNNAAAPKRRHVASITAAEVEQLMRLNFLSPVAKALAALPSMLARRRGVIVNVSSLGGRLGIANESAYCASKFALAGWSEAAALDLSGSGVDVRLIVPGAYDTEIWDQPGNDDALFDVPKSAPEECARDIVAAIEGSAFETYTPDLREIVVDKTRDIDGFITAMAAALPPAPPG
jgi:short-subunit dehydrogenase